MEPVAQQANQANVEYWFRLLYECFHGSCYGTADFSSLQAFLANLWLWIVAIGYILSVIALFVIMYEIVRLFELRKKEGEFYRTLIVAQGKERGGHPRWKHIEELASGDTPSQWREAIIEADIMLDDVLTAEGYIGAGVGEKLQGASFATIQDAWEAHKVRNQIAHQGSAFDLSETLARRTIARYEAVFREFKAI